jgi:hypothetical protein
MLVSSGISGLNRGVNERQRRSTPSILDILEAESKAPVLTKKQLMEKTEIVVNKFREYRKTDKPITKPFLGLAVPTNQKLGIPYEIFIINFIIRHSKYSTTKYEEYKSALINIIFKNPKVHDMFVETDKGHLILSEKYNGGGYLIIIPSV